MSNISQSLMGKPKNEKYQGSDCNVLPGMPLRGNIMVSHSIIKKFAVHIYLPLNPYHLFELENVAPSFLIILSSEHVSPPPSISCV
jgi:hypothetical protein